MKFLLIFTLSTLGFSVLAQNSNQQISVESVDSSSSQGGYDVADELITNRRFRAQTGSLSNWSINSSLGYDGGSLSDPLNVERPNLNAAGDIAAIQGMNANVGVAYRLSKKDRIRGGIGLQMLAPFHNSIDTEDAALRQEFEDNQRELDVNNPSLAISRVDNYFGIQTVLEASVLQYTAGVLTDRGFGQRARVSVNTMYDFGDSGFSAGVLFLGSRYFNDDLGDAGAARQLDSDFAVLPQFEYVINDTFNLRTISRAYWYQQNALTGDFNRLAFTQSAGLGISVSRDVFLYPNVQFMPEDMSFENTNIGLSANINLF